MVRKSPKKSKINKSKAIRDYKADNPDAKPREIADYMQKHGHDITPQYVSTILSSAKRKDEEMGLSSFSDLNLSAEDLILVKQLVAKTGSPKAAKRAVDLYTQLMA